MALTPVFIFIGIVLAGVIITFALRVESKAVRAGAALTAAAVFLAFFSLSSFRYVGEGRVGIIVKNAFGPALPPGKIIATEGEKGPQAKVLPPGWHMWLWPIVYDIEYVPITVIEANKVGILTAADGQPLPQGSTYAPEWNEADRKRMAEDAVYYLTEGKGYKGPQSSVLTPGTYRINTKLFKVQTADATNIAKATVGVVKSNVGEEPPETSTDPLVPRGMSGIWKTPLIPNKYYINPNAMEITVISNRKRIVRYTAFTRSGADSAGEEKEIRVRTADGFTFPVDVRIEYMITPEDAPLVVASTGDDQEDLRGVLHSAVRAIFRNNAEKVQALDYVKQRSAQEIQSLEMLATEMKKIGVTITAVRIGDVGDEQTLGNLLKTQTDREIAKQEQITFLEQQKAAETRKGLTRTEQEAEEEKRLATAKYEVQIADEDKKKRIISAEAEAEAIQIEAAAQADAFRLIAEQIGKSNAALVELLKIIGEREIEITPRVMVAGGNGNGSMSGAETTALIGTMLDTMVSRDPEQE